MKSEKQFFEDNKKMNFLKNIKLKVSLKVKTRGVEIKKKYIIGPI
jgi:hypothetical protein